MKAQLCEAVGDVAGFLGPRAELLNLTMHNTVICKVCENAGSDSVSLG